MSEIRFYRATGPNGYLSNLYVLPAPCLQFEGYLFNTSEAAYQFGKPKDLAVAQWLIAAPKPHLCALTAHALLVFDVKPDWNQNKVDRMRAVLKAKFNQHPELANKLIATGEAKLIEASKTDAFWGIGKKGTGKNMLGILLMELRKELSES